MHTTEKRGTDETLASFSSRDSTLREDATAQRVQKSGLEAPIYLQGLRLHLLTLVINLSFFLVHVEVSVVGTALVAITDDLHGYGRSSWVVTGYLLSYIGFMVIMAKLSDHISRKVVLLGSLATFIIFSGACGAAWTMIQLICLRVFQGLGASGTFSLGIIVQTEMVPRSKYPVYSMILALMTVLSLLLGPIIGGAVSENTTWRWVFLMNVPPGVILLALLTICLPRDFPYMGDTSHTCSLQFRRLDVIGAGLMLVAVTLLITGFEEASDFSPWTSAGVLAPIVVSGVAWILFLVYERHVTPAKRATEPVFPWRFCTSRTIVGLLGNSFILGTIFITLVIQIPLRYQIVGNESPVKAGLRLIAFGAAIPVGSTSSGLLCQKRRVPPIFLFFLASLFTILGLLFMSRVAIDDISWSGLYGLQFVTGVGCGIMMGMVTLLPPFVAEQDDLATCTASVIQFRSLGGALALSLVTAIMNHSIQNSLLPVLGPQKLAQIFLSPQSLNALDEPLRSVVKEVFWKGFNMQLRILLGFAVAQVPATMLMWKWRGKGEGEGKGDGVGGQIVVADLVKGGGDGS
ncbi:putative multidrug resistance protein fnx1 [Lophiostoma macrostomum CBS 122681]|uniref:Putative multidrug resistance protein fnx1 n=1 Tax=Lophiostoma macrostomum CBS 122681 TaxID=1314788 RepID=A0A6A6TCW8_9PLEO|nr:putative multidrug resistance protein fnx1 [Lophiostoma macrostomum CBS 122681]